MSSVLVDDLAEKEPMLTLCCRADMTLDKFLPTTTMICGMSRQGKSTFFNWLMDHRLIGCKNGTKVFYQLKSTDAAAAAKVSEGMKSVTLIPNVSNWNNQTLADMAGFGDKRDYRGVLGVSYMLKGAFQKIERCRFIIVIQSKNVQDQKFFRTIEGFLNMFHYDSLDKKQKQLLLNSMVLVITKAKSYEDQYLQNLQKLAQQLEDTQYEGTKMRSQILEVIAHILQKKCIYLFKMAQYGQEAPQCNFQEMLKQTWTYFPLQAIQQKKPVIKLPFEQDFSKLDKKQKEEFKSVLDNRIESYKYLAENIQNFIHKADQNIHQAGEYSKQFAKCKQFILKYDIYPAEFQRHKFIEMELKIREGIKNPSNKGLFLAKKIFELYGLLGKFPLFDQIQKKIKKFMEQLKIHTKKIFVELRDAFCTDTDQEQIILQLIFIALRGYRQFLMLFEINGGSQHGTKDIHQNDICRRIVDRYQTIIQKPLSQIQGTFVQGLIVYKGQKENDKKMIEKQVEQFNFLDSVTDLKQIQEYSDYLQRYKELYPGNATSPKFIKIYLLILNKRANKYIGQKNQRKGIKSFYYLLQEQVKFAKSKKREYLEEQVDEEQMTKLMNDLELKLIDILTQMAECLMKQKEFNHALEIYQYIGCVQSTCQAYIKIIENFKEDQWQDKYDWYIDYGRYCCENGRVQIGRKAYQKLLSLTTKNYEQRQKVKQLIKDTIQKVSTYQTKFLKNITEKGHLDPEDVKLQELMKLINDQLVQKINEEEQEELAKMKK